MGKNERIEENVKVLEIKDGMSIMDWKFKSTEPEGEFTMMNIIGSLTPSEITAMIIEVLYHLDWSSEEKEHEKMLEEIKKSFTKKYWKYSHV